MSRFLVTVPSHRRPHLVERFPTKPDVWVVNDDKDVKDYRAAGAENVVMSGGRLSANRNLAIELALREKAVSVQLDDDLRAIHRVWHDGSQWEHTTSTPIRDVVAEVWQSMRIAGTPLGGILASPNPYHAQQRIHTWAFIEGTVMIIDPRLTERFTMPTKEDWEMTCKVLRSVGCVARIDHYVRDSDYMTLPGGQYGHRTPEKEAAAANALLRDFPALLRRHSTRSRTDVQLRATRSTMPRRAKLAYAALNPPGDIRYSYSCP